MKIHKLKVDSFMNLDIEIEVDGKNVIVTGKNGVGKSTAIDTIWYGLTNKNVPDEPIQKGKDSAQIEVTISRDDEPAIIATRKFKRTEKGIEDTLTVRTEGSAAFGSPQSFLDNLIGRISFDPFQFSNLTPLDQKKKLQEILGVDLSGLESKKKVLLTEKKQQADTIKNLETELSKLPEVTEHLTRRSMDEIADKQKEISDIRTEKENIKAEKDAVDQSIIPINTKREAGKTKKTAALVRIQALENEIRTHNQEIALIEANDEIFETEINTLSKQSEDLNTKWANVVIPDDSEIQKTVEEINQHNERVTQMDQALSIKLKIETATGVVEKKKSAIEKLEEDRKEMLRNAKIPVEGLDFGDDSLTLDGLPFTKNQFSTARRNMVGFQITISMNPGLRILRVKDWILLDDETKAQLVDLAAEHDFQIFAEQVNNDKFIGFRIGEKMIADDVRTDN